MPVQMVDFHVPDLSHFEYLGYLIPIVLHGCSKLEKATIRFHMASSKQVDDKALDHVFTGIPSISAVKVLNVFAYMHEHQSAYSSSSSCTDPPPLLGPARLRSGVAQKRRPLESERPAPAAPPSMAGAGGDDSDKARPPLDQQEVEEAMATKLRRLEHHRSVSDALTRQPSPSPPFAFNMEDLPEEIQHLIMSLLPPKEAARASIVSRNWRNLWTRYPNLCFDGTKDQSTYQDSIKIERAKFSVTVHYIIQQHSATGLNEFSVRCGLRKKHSRHLDRWIKFATASKVKIIDIDPESKSRKHKKRYRFPLKALGAQDSSFLQSLFLTDVSIKPLPCICGFTKLRRLVLHFVKIIGDLSCLLSKCSVLEELELISCSDVANLNIPHQLDNLRHLLISCMPVQMVDFNVPELSHFEYLGDAIRVVLHGCSKLEKTTVKFRGYNKTLDHAFSAIPSISSVKVLNVHATMLAHQLVWASPSQVHTLTTRPTCMFMNLRHLSCEIIIFTNDPNSHNGMLQLAHYLDFAPQLEMLQLHMHYLTSSDYCWDGEGTGEEVSHMRRLDRLKMVYMSGFRCYRAQVELLCSILEKGAVLEHVTIEPKVIKFCIPGSNSFIPACRICEWAQRAAEHYGKVIDVVGKVKGEEDSWQL